MLNLAGEPFSSEAENSHGVGHVVDLDGDGLPDLVSGNMVYLNSGGAFLEGQRFWTSGQLPLKVKSGDLDGDGDLDLVALPRDGTPIKIYTNPGASDFTDPRLVHEVPVSQQFDDIEVIEDEIFVTADGFAGSIKKTTDWETAPTTTISTDAGAQKIIKDEDGGYVRIVGSAIHLSASQVSSLDGNDVIDVAFGDVDGDRITDLVYVTTAGAFVIKGTGDWTAAHKQIGASWTSRVPAAIKVADLDNNGYDDLYMALNGGQLADKGRHVYYVTQAMQEAGDFSSAADTSLLPTDGSEDALSHGARSRALPCALPPPERAPRAQALRLCRTCRATACWTRSTACSLARLEPDPPPRSDVPRSHAGWERPAASSWAPPRSTRTCSAPP